MMKEKIGAVILLITVIGFVIVNSLILKQKIDKTIESVQLLNIDDSNINDRKNNAEEIFRIFEKYEIFISLTVSHDDLTNIENSFVEMIGYLSVEDVENAQVAKSRLIHSLEHLRRLSGLNFDAII